MNRELRASRSPERATLGAATVAVARAGIFILRRSRDENQNRAEQIRAMLRDRGAAGTILPPQNRRAEKR
jgi:hypothetical protein